MKPTRAAVATLALLVGCASPESKPSNLESTTTPKRPVVDVYHGVSVTDDYRWLEDARDPEVRAWSDGQNARTREFLDHLPNVDAIRKRVTELMTRQTVSYRGLVARGETLLAMKSQPPKPQPLLVAMKAPGDPATERVVLDPSALDAKGTTAIDFYVPSLDGKFVAVSLSQRGSESGAVHVYDVATGRETGDVISRVNGGTAGGSVAWNADGSGFFYTRYPRDGERAAQDMDFFQQVWFHKIGTPTSSDTYEIGREFPRIAEIHLSTDDKGVYVLANVGNGDGGEHAFWVRGPKGAWKQIAKFEDQVVAAAIDCPVGAINNDASLVMLSRKDAPRGKILLANIESPDGAETVVPESNATIERFVLAGPFLYVVDQTGGPEQLRAFRRELDSKRGSVGTLTRLTNSSISEVVRLADNSVLVRHETYVSPPGWTRESIAGSKFSPASGRLPISDAAADDFPEIRAAREFATSKDGTRVPMTIVRPKNAKLDGTNPTLLSGYCGYGISMAPRYRATLRVWLDQGGVYVVANIRGGGEFGEEWHKAGNLTKKQNVFDDFAACAARLVELGYTKPEKLALEGGSNGGLLMGAMIVQHPEIARAVVSHVGIYDMLRVETTPNGAFNVTEFGTVKDEAQFKALYAYSPYHHVVDGAAYPSVLFMTGANDPRVDPYNSRKMTARLQAATSSARPVLLRTSAESGHGMGSSLAQRIEEQVDVHAFLFHELGVEFRAP